MSHPGNGETPAFEAPWQAQAFAMTLTLHERGLFTWSEWAQALGAQVASAPALAQEDATTAYWRQWLAALEHLVATKGAASPADLRRHQQAWDRAADRTPHGQPVELAPADFAGAEGGPG